MKRTTSLRSFVLLISMMTLFSVARSQTFIPVRGTGPSVDKKINISGFRGIEVSSGIDVILAQGNSESLTLTVQENLFKYITTTVENGTLKIYCRNNIRPTQPMKAHITFKDINSLKVSGGGDTYSDTPVSLADLNVNISGGGDFNSVINSGVLKLRISGGGDAEIGGKIKDYIVSVSGGGDLESRVDAAITSCRLVGGGDLHLRDETQSSEADIDISGGGDADIKLSAEKLKCSVSGGGDALISGQAREFDIDVNGGGDVDARDLSTETTSFNARGGSGIRVKVSKELSGHISGGGDIYYSGDPAKLSVDASGGSKVKRD